MKRSREDLLKFFSEELIDHEIERVKNAQVGESVFFMESWEIDDWVVSILSFADVSYTVKDVGGIKHYIKTQGE